MPITAHGDLSIKEQPGSPEIRMTREGRIVTRVFQGTTADLAAFAPDYGADMDGYKVREWTLKTNVNGGLSTLTIHLDNLSTSDPEYEVEWVEVQKDLLTHPRYNSGGTKPLSDDDRTALEIWRNEPRWSLKKAFQYDDNGTIRTLSSNAQDFAKKILAGTDSYVVYAPVVRKKSYSITRPPTGQCGTRQTPPALSGYPPGYQWIKTGDRRLYTGGRWERYEEWTGVDRVDNDIYPD